MLFREGFPGPAKVTAAALAALLCAGCVSEQDARNITEQGHGRTVAPITQPEITVTATETVTATPSPAATETVYITAAPNPEMSSPTAPAPELSDASIAPSPELTGTPSTTSSASAEGSNQERICDLIARGIPAYAFKHFMDKDGNVLPSAEWLEPEEIQKLIDEEQHNPGDAYQEPPYQELPGGVSVCTLPYISDPYSAIFENLGRD